MDSCSVNFRSINNVYFRTICAGINNKHNIAVEKISLTKLKKENIEDFLDWIETERKCSISTRNVRLAALHSFFKYLQYEVPDFLFEWQRILSIPVKKCEKGIMSYMTIDGIKLLLQMPDVSTRDGRRDLALLSLMYDTGARVQEIIDLTPSCVRFESPYTVKLTGKGSKTRIVPLMEKEACILRRYMKEEKLLTPAASNYPLFFNRRKEKLTRAGVGYILQKYVKMARNINSILVPDTFTCHCLRHSKAMHLLQAGVNLVYIRDILGHSSVQVTEIYARVDSKQKREAIEQAYTDTTPTNLPIWQTNKNLLEWLRNFNC